MHQTEIVCVYEFIYQPIFVKGNKDSQRRLEDGAITSPPDN